MADQNPTLQLHTTPTHPSLTAHSIPPLALLILILFKAQSILRNYLRLRHIPPAHFSTPFSYLWLGRTTYSGRQYHTLRALHTLHGPLVRIGPHEVLTDDPSVLRTVSGTRSNYPRSDWYHAGRFNPYHDNLLTITEPEAHKRAKKRSMAAYNGRDTAGLEGAVDEQVEMLLRVVSARYADGGEGEGKVLDLTSVTKFFTMDVITRLGFGRAVGYLVDERDHYEFLGTVDGLWPRMSTVADVPWLRKVLFSRFVLGLVGPKSSDRTGFGALMGFAADQVSRRFASPDKSKKDFLASLMAHGFTEEECQSEGLFLLLAGSESTANAMRSVLVHTITSPAVYNRLGAEIHAAVQSHKVSYPITLEQAQKLPYLQAVIYEGLRMRPPILGLFPKIVPANEAPPVFHGKTLPPGTAVCMNMSSMLQSTALFGADTAVFRPERFMEADKERRRQMELDVEMVFGYGGWVCAGKTIAMMEMGKVVFELFRLFDLQLVSPFEPCDTIGYGVFSDKGLKVRVSAKT